ncbi:class II aldolase/adducin family protein [Tessaracoccus flavescens]|nr:class II aldolase/adducin family protein [Tessaracoccus flavescens]
MSAQLHDELIRLANEFGSDEAYARAGGGNASVKHGGVLYIKPSGTTLATLRDNDLVPLRIPVLLEALVSDEEVDGDPVMAAATAARVGDPGGRRPSVEILFHALIPDSLVLHLHPLVANALTCHEDGRALAERLLGNEAIWVDYTDPGVPLAKEIHRERQAFEARTGHPAPAITLMGNHGIIVSGNNRDEVAQRITWLSATIQAAIDETPAPVVPQRADDGASVAEAFRVAAGRDAIAWSNDDVVRSASSLSAAAVSRGPLIPDQIVYAGSFPVILEGIDDVEAAVASYEAEHGRQPITAVAPGQCVASVGDTDKAATIALGTFLDALVVGRDADRLGGSRVLNERERHFIETWEAESYRQQVSAGS